MVVEKSTPGSPPQATLELYEKLVATIPGIERKGASMPYTSLNGNMFSFIAKNGDCGIRLPEKEREAFIRKYKTQLFETHGTVLKEYVAVPANLLKNTKDLKKWFEISFAYAQTFKPKSAKKRASATAKKPTTKKNRKI